MRASHHAVVPNCPKCGEKKPNPYRTGCPNCRDLEQLNRLAMKEVELRVLKGSCFKCHKPDVSYEGVLCQACADPILDEGRVKVVLMNLSGLTEAEEADMAHQFLRATIGYQRCQERHCKRPAFWGEAKCLYCRGAK